MQSSAVSPEAYLEELPPGPREAIRRLREDILANLPPGFAETMSYGMIAYVVPHSVYPAGYHVNPEQPLPFMAIASQKRHIALYHSGLYLDKDLASWFTGEFQSRAPAKLDMGKSCIRFRKAEHIPYGLIAELCRKLDPEAWIRIYEDSLGHRGRRRPGT